MNRFSQLLDAYIKDQLSQEELQEFFLLLDDHVPEMEDRVLEEFLSHTNSMTTPELREIMFQNILNRSKGQKPGRVRRIWPRIAVAASIILLLGIATYVILSAVEGRHKEQPAIVAKDVAPPKNTRAVITLANGSKVYLDSAGNGVLAQENNVAVIRNADGSIEYNRKDAKTQGETAYNTIFNPRGSKVISLTLSDGTKVWLNSESSLRYPASFVASAVSREVEITGEAYFEVKHNSKQPFKVYLPNGSIVEDLGTGFNINAYNDEASIKTTLIEGSVQITAANAATAAVKLKPGEQSVISLTSPNHYITTSPDIEEVLAWKNGRFELAGATIEPIMREISRWYDVQVEYRGPKPTANFMGGTSRQNNVSELLKILEQTGAVKFEIEGKKIIVSK